MDLETPTYEINLTGGTRGLQGPEGKIGPQGKPGPQGEPGMGVPDGGEEGQTIIKQGNATIWDFFDFSKLKNKPTKLSQFNNDTNFVDHTVSNLINYYDKNSTYTKEEINQMISSVATMSVQVVEELPTTDISSTTIYLRLKTTGEESNVYDEYLYVNNTWEKIGDTSLDLSNYATKDYVDQLISSSKMDMLPVGTVFPWFSNDIPTNFLELNGQAVSRTIYSDLFELYGTTYGTGDGSTTFNLPNLSGRVPVGLDSDDTDFNEVGKTYGEKDHTLLEEELAEHVHKGLEFWNKAVTFDAGSGEGYNLQYGNSINPGYVAELWTNESGGNQPHNNVQPSIVVKYIVKAQYSDGHLSEEAEVVDNFDSTSSTNALSANMGRELKAMLDTFFQKKIFLKATASTIQDLNSNTNINLDTVSYTNDNTNEFFKLENGSIKVVSSAINSIKISGAVNVENAQLNGYLWVRVKKNNTTVAGQIVNHQEGIGYIGGVIPSTIIDVSAGDVITLNVDCPIVAKTRGASYDKFLMVETVSANINTTTSFNYEVIQNQNGTAIKYNDGRLECYGLVNATDLPNNTWGPFYSKDKNITFPVEFIEKPTVVANAYGNSGMYFCGLGSDSSLTTTGCTIRLMSVQTIQATEYWFTYRAVGRWKE